MESNPILNAPYYEPRWHYATDLQGNLNYEDIRKDRRVFDPNLGGYSMPVMRQKQGSLIEVNELAQEYGTHLINLLRTEVGNWRKAAYPDTTGATRDLLRYWFLNPERHATRSLFFAQREAIETAIWLNEIASKSNAGNHILNKLRESLASADDVLPRICMKMATGTGKTVVMAALILYHYFNRQEYRQDTRFIDYFLLVAPGITIKDRLGVLYVDNTTHDKNKAKDYYRERDLVPPRFERLLDGLNARLVITNYHAFEPKTLQGNKRSVFDGKLGPDGKKQEGKEEMTQVIKRLLKNFKKGSRLLVINDEAHHCYLPKEKGKTKSDAPADENVKEENERAAVWYTGLREIGKQFQLRAVYDLSATPYYLSGSGHAAYTLFPWIVSDFGLTDAIESGLVKIPFLPEFDNTQELTPVLRDLYAHVKDELPKKGAVKQRAEAKKEGKVFGEEPPKLPMIVQTALDQFFNHYKQYEIGIRAHGERGSDMFTEPPVFIAVCNNTNVSKEIYKHIAGYEYITENGETAIMPGTCDLFNNYEEYGGLWRAKRRPPTLLIDSDALENSNQINDDFKKVFAPEIEAFKRDYRQRHPDKSVENLTDADMLREVVKDRTSVV
jgi:type III restriction enzyme